jgi:hypothetical protein
MRALLRAGITAATICLAISSDAASNVSALSAPLSVTTSVLPPPPPPPQILWSAGMETGDLTEWSGSYNSGSANSAAVTAFSAGIPPKTGIGCCGSQFTMVACLFGIYTLGYQARYCKNALGAVSAPAGRREAL